MIIFQPLTQGLFDPRLQLEAEAREYRASPRKAGQETPNIHADIVQTIAALDLLAGQLRQPPTR